MRVYLMEVRVLYSELDVQGTWERRKHKFGIS